MKWGSFYGPKHVNILERMVRRHLDMDYKFVCITDEPEGIGCKTIHPDRLIRSEWQNSEGCFRRLDLFHHKVRDVLGERFVSIDLDCVIMDNITPLLGRTEDFVAWAHPVHKGRYCGSMFMMNSGSRREVYSAHRARDPKYAGTDQTVMSRVLGSQEAVWTGEDGVYTKLRIRNTLPNNARIVFYPGPRDPSGDRTDWATKHWK